MSEKSGFSAWLGGTTRVVIAALIVWQSSVSAEDIRYRGIRVPDQTGKAVTVLGPIDPRTLGSVLMHEHLFVNTAMPVYELERWQLLGQKAPATVEELALWSEPVTIENRTRLIASLNLNKDASTLDSVDDAVKEIRRYQALGGRALVDVTTIGIRVAEQARKLRETAELTGAHIVMGTGFYRRPWYPEDMDRFTVDDLTARMLRELAEGVDGTNIKAGIIGEIPVENLVLAPHESTEVKVLRAAARASRMTGAAVSLHCSCVPGMADDLHIGLDVLREEGVDLSRVIVGHAINMNLNSANDVGMYEGLLRRGVYLQFDLLGMPHFDLYQGAMLSALKTLIMRGYAKQLLVSQDTFYKMQLTKYGGYGYTYVHARLIPYLKSEHVDHGAIDDILEHNPGRVLGFVKPQLLQR